jgi:O-acetyl-ADP-ribose deacetylase (regulator of RNase III)
MKNYLKKHNYYYILVLAFLILCRASCQCNNPNTEEPAPNPTTPALNPTPPTPPPTPPGGGTVDEITLVPIPTGVIQKTVTIDSSDEWIKKVLGETWWCANACVVNAENTGLGGGGGIDGALISWANAKGITTPWNKNENVKSPYDDTRVTSVGVGGYAVCKVNQGRIYSIYLAVGPQANQVDTLAKTSKMIEDLYYGMLNKANNTGISHIVLCAVSTSLFASSGKEKETGKLFTKEQFIRSAYNGMHNGINRFKKDRTGGTLNHIILNNWDPK